ncbi:MAG: TlpA family protein disulfide reductase [Candidatus Eremiobacteraeota bacterium]|nr:TlpA family protein disulfide reductase [Candidatus Eremiobacteraeota bacterium]
MNCSVRYLSILVATVALAAPALASPHAGDVAPPFSLGKPSGGKVALQDFKGRPLYINFFASWCTPCNEEASAIARLYRAYHGRGLTIVGVDELEDASKANGFARKYKWLFPVGLDADGTTARDYGALGLPTQIFVDRQGRVSTYRLGVMDPGEIEDAIRKIL